MNETEHCKVIKSVTGTWNYLSSGIGRRKKPLVGYVVIDRTLSDGSSTKIIRGAIIKENADNNLEELLELSDQSRIPEKVSSFINEYVNSMRAYLQHQEPEEPYEYFEIIL